MSLDISEKLRSDYFFSTKEKISIVYMLSMPAILAQISEIIMQYIDAAMVGTLGAGASASIGLIASSTWLFGGLLSAIAAGFAVQVSHAVGAGDNNRAKSIFKQSIIGTFSFSLILLLVATYLSFRLPMWLKAEETLWQDATNYFLVFALFIPIRMISTLSMNMLQCSGNMKIPSIFLTLMCILDVIFNYFLIFPTRTVSILGNEMNMFGAGLGVLGAQLGTSLSVLFAGGAVFFYALFKSDVLNLRGFKGSWIPKEEVVSNAIHISVPMAFQQSGLSLAHVVSTRIIAPLGTIAIAAHSFAITAESICYMPGYGISNAATTLVGQSVGAKNRHMAKSFAWLTLSLAVLIMSLFGLLMYFFCPYVFRFLTPVEEVQVLGASVLRIQLLVEPLFAAAIVATGALRGAGDTLVPGIINVGSMWFVRLTLAYILSSRLGLPGCWIAMAIDNSLAGVLLMLRLRGKGWLKKAEI